MTQRNEATLARLRKTLLEIRPSSGDTVSPIPGLNFSRHDSDERLYCKGEGPVLALIVNGHKSTRFGDIEHTYHAGQMLLAGANIPSVFHANGATPASPLLCVAVKLDRAILMELANKFLQPSSTPSSCEACLTFTPPEDLLEDVTRLVELVRNPALAEVRAPLIYRDIHCLLMTSPTAEHLLPLLTERAPASSVVRAIDWLRNNFDRPFTVEELARQNGMSVSNFHRQFKTVTGMSPLQYQKQLRLFEAQHLMLNNRVQVAEAAYAVGYESPTQFVREYKRQFGLPPMKDIRSRRCLICETCEQAA